MDLGSIFLIIALLGLVALFIGQPLFEGKPNESDAKRLAGALQPAINADQEDQKHSALLAERDRVLNALSELDFDYVVGKIPEEDYPAQRSTLLEHGVVVLRELDAFEMDEINSEKSVSGTPVPYADTPEARLEAAIAARRLATAPTGSLSPNGGGKPAADDDIEIQIAVRRRLRQEKAAGFCPQCGGPVKKSDRFCPKCGASQK